MNTKDTGDWNEFKKMRNSINNVMQQRLVIIKKLALLIETILESCGEL